MDEDLDISHGGQDISVLPRVIMSRLPYEEEEPEKFE